MEIILKQDIDKLGFKDEVVTVKNGYGRNYLIPKGLAELATPSKKKMLEETLRQRSHKESKVLEEANTLASKIEKIKLKIKAKVGENGKIFGSVTSVQLSEALKENGIEIGRKNITISGDAIKSVGEYQAEAQIYKSVKATVNFEVVEG